MTLGAARSVTTDRSEMVRITVDRDDDAAASPKNEERPARISRHAPLIGDFSRRHGERDREAMLRGPHSFRHRRAPDPPP